MLALALGLAAATDASFWAAAIEVGGSQSGAAGGILNTGGNLGGLIAPVLTPWIAARYGWSEGLYFGCFIVLVGAALWFFISPTKSALDKSFEFETLNHT
jgi:dipeptide/tripeptide permease